MSNSFKKVSDHLYKFSDSCNVYVIKNGENGILIDAGSGNVLRHLDKLDITNVDWVLHTHHHRDQCWGDERLVESGAKIAVPEHERYLFDQVENFWNHKRIFDNYNDRGTFFSRAEDVTVTKELEDYETFSWEDYEFRILPARGHTAGSIMLIGEIDGKNIVFSGDLLHKGGKIYHLYDMEYEYGDMKGLLFTDQAAENLMRKDPDKILPSHGPIIDNPLEDIKNLRNRIRRLVNLTNPTTFMGSGLKEDLMDRKLYKLSDHLLWGGLTCSNFYVILSDSNKAIFIDYGHAFGEHMITGTDREDEERMRFVVHHLYELFNTYNVEEIDAVIPTHIHDDHTCGIPYLQKHQNAECWALEDMVPVLEKPSKWSSQPCCFHEPIEVQKTFSDGEKFTWEGYPFEIYHCPGQTEFHSAIVASIDGLNLAFTGDNIFKKSTQTWGSKTEEIPIQTQVFRNSFQLSMHEKCRKLIKKIQPDKICPGHGEPFEFDDLKAKRYADYINKKESLFRELSPDPPEQNVDLFWARLLPYQSQAKPGDKKEFCLLLRNNFKDEVEFESRLILPNGWKALDESGRTKLEPNSKDEIIMTAKAPDNLDNRGERDIVTAEVLIDGNSKGPVPEAVVNY